jgi:hypothetical protein
VITVKKLIFVNTNGFSGGVHAIPISLIFLEVLAVMVIPKESTQRNVFEIFWPVSLKNSIMVKKEFSHCCI